MLAIADWISSHECTVSPLTATIRAPGLMCRNEAASGGTSSGSTRPTVVTGSNCRPFLAARKVKTAHAKSAFIVTPARITTIRFHTGLASNIRPGGTSAAGCPPSSGLLPMSSSRLAIFTYPPSGSQEIEYSVSPRRKESHGIGGPRPSENRWT